MDNSKNDDLDTIPKRKISTYLPGNITTDVILRELQNHSIFISTQYGERYYSQLEKNYKKEELKQISNSLSSCPVNKQNVVNKDINRMSKDSKEYLNNYDKAESLSCYMGSIFNTMSFNKGRSERSEIIQDGLQNLKVFGEKSANGIAMKGDIDNNDNMFVIKVSKSSKDDADIIHEALVGALSETKIDGKKVGGLNNLRKHIPNFSFVYGMFACGEPLINDRNNEVVELCNGENKKSYIVYESIIPSVSFDTYVTSVELSDMVSCFLQVVLATIVANEYNGYTHYDLHGGNVLVRTLNAMEVFQIPYTSSNGKTWYLKARDIVSIIDYGMTRIQIGNKQYGKYSTFFAKYGIENTQSWPLYDCYKLLCFTMLNLTENESVIYRDEKIAWLSLVLQYFNNQENPYDVIRDQYKTYYALPKVDGIDIYGFLDYLINKCGCDKLVPTKPDNDLAYCNCNGTTYKIDSCTTTNYNLNKEDMSFIAIYDLKLKEIPYNKNSDFYKKAYSVYVDKRTNILHSLKYELLPTIKSIDTKSILDNPKYLGENVILSDIKTQFYTYVKCINFVERLNLYNKIGYYISKLYSEPHLKSRIIDDVKWMKEALSILSKIKTSMLILVKIIKSYIITRDYDQDIHYNPDFLWYSDNLRNMYFTIKDKVINVKGLEYYK